MPAETVVGRLEETVQALTRRPQGPKPTVLGLDLPDAQALLAIIAGLCDDHTACEACDTTLCVTCGVGEPADCEHRNLCTGCWPAECRVCMAEVAADPWCRTDAAYETAREGRG
jgi:hypothetical protein